MKCIIIIIRFNHPTGIYDPKIEKGDYNYNVPVGLAYISAFLKQSGHKIHFLNLNHRDGIVDELIKDTLSKNRYDFVITGGISPFYPDVKGYVDSVRRHAPTTQIILGGGLISSQPEIMFDLLRPDYGIIGEGELTIKELFECLENKGDINTVKGLIFRNSEGNIIITKPRDPIHNLDLLPWPDYEGLGFDDYLDHMLPTSSNYHSIFDYPRVYPIIASRSCPFACTFCFHPLGKKYRKRSVENIISELDYAIKKYKINIIMFYDELLANDRVWVNNFCTRLAEFLKTIPWEVKWACQMRVDILDEEMMIIMKNAGCYFFSLGLESYSTTVLKSMNKVITPKQIDNVLHLCTQHNMAVTGNFIFGDTAETTQTYQETLNYWKENDKIIRNAVALFPITLYQGSPLYKLALEKGIIKDEIAFIEKRAAKGDFPINFTDKMSDNEFEKMQQDITEAYVLWRRGSVPLLNKKINGTQEVHIKCPYCNNISVYRNIILPPKFSNWTVFLICRECHARIIIDSKSHRTLNLIYRIIGFKNTHTIKRYVFPSLLFGIRNSKKLINKFIN